MTPGNNSMYLVGHKFHCHNFGGRAHSCTAKKNVPGTGDERMQRIK